MGILEQIVEESSVKPIVKIHGLSAYSFKDDRQLAKKELAEEKLAGKQIEFGNREQTPDGMGYTRTQSRHYAVNPDILFANRYRRVMDAEKNVYYEVVIDYRAIQEQGSGKIYSPLISAYIIGQGPRKSYQIIGQKKIKDEEFINEFRRHLGHKDMATILSMIGSYGEESTGDEMKF